MAELFSLMPNSTSCKTDRVEATRTLSRTISPASFQRNISRPGTGINPTTKTRRHKELTHFHAPRAEMGILRVLVSVFLSVFVFSFSCLQKVQKSMTKKTAETNPSPQILQQLQGVYFLSH
jgi:hypothetical protein